MRIAIFALILLTITGCSQAQLGAHLAKQATANSRSKGYFKVGNPYVIDGKRYYPKESYDLEETGIASWYGPNFHGRKTANGEIFNRYELTAAHKTLQLPCLVRVTNLENGRSLVVRINDRGPYRKGRIIDLSEKSASLLGYKIKGTARVRIQVLGKESREIALAARHGKDTSGMEIAVNGESAYSSSAIDSTRGNNGILNVSSLSSSDYASPVSGHPVSGHVENGLFMPDPVVSHVSVQPTGIYVQAGSYTVRENALKTATKLARLGNAKVYPVKINGVDYFRVRVGPFQQVNNADRVLLNANTAGFRDAVIVVE